MYLEHFGLNEPPFRITPITVFFFSGANRGEILDALIYSLSEAEGIIKVSGEVGSGKTMLCRMLLEKLPEHIETIYLANPSLSREEMLYAIADALGLDIGDERIGVIMHNIQNKLEEKAREGKRVVVLVDEAHAMPLDTLEELRLLYNLQVGNAKLLQIILFGQPELNAKLDQPNMRQLKDRIVHHFHMQPLSRNALESYLMFRMRAAGYHGPNIFSPDTVKLIASASNGLMRRVNILADKSLLAAFVEDTHDIKARHVRAAMRDSELKPADVLSGKKLLAGGAVAALLLAAPVAWWALDKQRTEDRGQNTEINVASLPAPATATPPADAPHAIAAQPESLPVPTPGTETAQAAVNASTAPRSIVTRPDNLPAPASGTEAVQAEVVANPPPQPGQAVAAVPPVADNDLAISKLSLFEQRMAAGKQLLEQKNTVASIQLFYNETINQKRTEGFLIRADKLGTLSEIYLLPARFGGKAGLRVLYGTYPSVDAARSGINDLPKRYQEAFAASVYIY
ncbi:MAG: AAA family ATPase [Gallionella sp.]|nr:AAA family ATPase [Gallionella sp.]